MTHHTERAAQTYMSFDSLAPLYDQTRMTSSRALDESLDYITERFPPLQFEHIFEPGIGTGRIAFPLAQRGYTITGVDPSANMLTVLQSRLTQEPAAITSYEGDATDLPFSDESFNMSVVVHVFDFIRNWKKAAHEIMRVTDKDGPIIAINTGSGSQIPSLSTRYKELCAEEGHPIIKLGAQSTRQVIDYFEVNEYQVEHIQNRWRWDNHLTPAEALSYIDQRAYSFTTTAPAAIHQRVMPRLTAEATEQYGDLSVPVAVPNEIKLDIICKNDPPAGMLSRAR